MNAKTTARKQYQAMIDRAAVATMQDLKQPREGWIASARKALGISAAQLGRMVGSTRANISSIERSEQNERATLRTMKTMAEAMGCRFVYAVIPAEGGIDDALKKQAWKKAQAIVMRASTHMALEQQVLSKDALEDEIKDLARDLLRDPPSDFWEKE